MLPTLHTFALLLCLLGADTAMAQGAYRYGPDEKGVPDGVVFDTRTGLTWRRCSEGQIWSNGQCNGEAHVKTYIQAMYHASQQHGWRAPNVKELASLLDTNRPRPYIDTDAFPNTPTILDSYYWSSTPNEGNPMGGWFVGFGNGRIGASFLNGLRFNLRLVR